MALASHLDGYLPSFTFYRHMSRPLTSNFTQYVHFRDIVLAEI